SVGKYECKRGCASRSVYGSQADVVRHDGLGLASRFSDKLVAQSMLPSKSGNGTSDREREGLRGAVRQVISDSPQTEADAVRRMGKGWVSSSVTEYDLEGNRL